MQQPSCRVTETRTDDDDRMTAGAVRTGEEAASSKAATTAIAAASSSSSIAPRKSSSSPSTTATTTSAKNLPWQKHFKLRVAPICIQIVDEVPAFLEGLVTNLKQHNGKFEWHKGIPVCGVADANRPPRDLEYNVVTIAVQCPAGTPFLTRTTSSEQHESGLHLVREIGSFPLSPGKPCITERLFMDRSRPLYKAKGWGIGNWRVWLALEDVDALRKKRKKTPSDSESTSVDKKQPGMMVTKAKDADQVKRPMSASSSASSSSSQKRVKQDSSAATSTASSVAAESTSIRMPTSTSTATVAAAVLPSNLHPLYSPTSVIMNSHLGSLLLQTGASSATGRQASMPSMLSGVPPPSGLTRSTSNGYPFPAVAPPPPPPPQQQQQQQQPQHQSVHAAHYVFHHPASTNSVHHMMAPSMPQGPWSAPATPSAAGLLLPSHLLGFATTASPPQPQQRFLPPHLWPQNPGNNNNSNNGI